MCGHFPEGVETFEKRSIEGETKGEWYVRQMLGSANISGSRFMHIMTGNLSHQIEHHLFPDLPSNRYGEVAPKVQEICRRSEEHTSELQSRQYLVCRLLLEKKKHDPTPFILLYTNASN